ncbi:hypothetical protein BESB_018650 [Besnoitia besnoiti]|uniref:t-SNARE coiled-coil homology domain-containing protein n=1 Tax=Besnoitia besnoiti TaxID=94643 RepID=A0A2A9MAA7_BESBE|nr:hypothetical protein BESB_018650 [Besnoitia besnoiti]PFH32547.1 hypothetical protein BESB_018650 [Besnoitia besnoiti]
MSGFHAGDDADRPRHAGLLVGFNSSRTGTNPASQNADLPGYERSRAGDCGGDGGYSGGSSSRSPPVPPGPQPASHSLVRVRDGDRRQPSSRHKDRASSSLSGPCPQRDFEECGDRYGPSSGRVPVTRAPLWRDAEGTGKGVPSSSVSLRSGQAARNIKLDRKVSFHQATRERTSSLSVGDDDNDGEGETCAEAAEQQLRTLDALLSELARAVDEVGATKKKGADALRNHQVKVQRLQQEIDTTLSALDLELRCIASSLRVAYRSSLLAQRQQKQQQAASLGRSYEDALLSVTCEDLLAYRAGAEEGDEEQETLREEKLREFLVQAGDDKQDKTQASLYRTKQMVAETEEMGAQILSTMNEHTEQLQKAAEELDEVQYNVIRAKKTAMAIAKNAAGDRFIQCLCLFIVLFLVIAIVLVCVPR